MERRLVMQKNGKLKAGIFILLPAVALSNLIAPSIGFSRSYDLSTKETYLIAQGNGIQTYGTVDPDVVRESQERQSSSSVSTGGFKMETPETQSLNTANSSTRPQPVAKKPGMLYGRIEQIASGTSVAFPELKALTPKMDTRGQKPLVGKASQTYLSGEVVKSFPTDYSGTWGGSVAIWSSTLAPAFYASNPNKAKYTALIMKPGRTGLVNFVFTNAGTKIALEPAHILFQVPMKDTVEGVKLQQMLGGMGGSGGGADGMGGMMQQMMGNMANTMDNPVTVQLGDYQTSSTEVSVDGGQTSQRLLKNTIRELSPGVLEQQIVTSISSQNLQTNRLENTYGETVIRFTKQSADQFYVQIATVTYDAARRFEERDIFYGTVRKGQPVNNTAQVPGIGNMGDINKMLQGGGGNGQIPNLQQLLPGGGSGSGGNPFQNLFPQ